jgi:NADPH-dependent ferric siderophore reductase
VKRPFPLHTGIAEVVRAERIVPSMARITLRHDCFGEGFGIEQPGEILTLGWDLDGTGLELPADGWRFPDGGRGDHWRNLTIRDWRPDAFQLDVDFFCHGDVGPASAWAERAAAGEKLGFAGPRVHWLLPERAEWAALVCDETGLPAALAIAEDLPVGLPMLLLAEVDGPVEEQACASAASAEIRWLHRLGAEPGSVPLLAAELGRTELPSGRGVIWGGGEAMQMRAVRELIAKTGRGDEIDRQILGYWKRDPDAEWE